MSGSCVTFSCRINDLSGEWMLHAKDHKAGYLFDPFGYLGTKRLQRLRESWPGLFRKEILPVLPVEKLMEDYNPSQGRPTKELYATLGAVLLQQMQDLTDEETIDRFAFDLQWHYALDITEESDQAAYLCAKTLWTMRTKVMREGTAAELFDRVTDKLKEVCEVDTDRQRLDSTQIFSNMRYLGRLRLIAQTSRKFLKNLKRKHPKRFEALSEEVRERYLPQRGQGVFALVKPSESEQTLRTLAEDLFDLIERFGKDQEITGMHSYQLLVRVFSEQCRVEEDGETGAPRIAVKANKEISGDSLQNPSDPDATYGHKGKGYQAQVMETYTEREEEEEDEAEPALNLITYVEVEGAHKNDSQSLIPALEKSRKEGRSPKQVLADSAYGSDDNCTKSRQKGVELIAPVLSGKPAPPVGLADFDYDERHRVRRCPQGHAPNRTRLNKQRHSARFETAVCEACPLREACPVEPGGRGHYLRYTNKELRLEKRKAHQETAAFRDRYRFRSGCEATMSELDRRTGIKHLRVRGMSAVRLCVFLKAAGLNILRASRLRGRSMKPKRGPNRPIQVLQRLLDSVRMGLRRFRMDIFGRYGRLTAEPRLSLRFGAGLAA